MFTEARALVRESDGTTYRKPDPRIFHIREFIREPVWNISDFDWATESAYIKTHPQAKQNQGQADHEPDLPPV